LIASFQNFLEEIFNPQFF